MGCDIHVMTEARWPWVKNSEKWQNVDNFRYNSYRDEYEDEPEYVLHSLYRGRDYELFSFLADVRNYGGNESFGFDRGIPEDAHHVTVQEYERWGLDAHTPGYCTLKELKEAVSKVRTIRREGAVAKEQVERFRETGETPTSWAQGVGQWRGIAPEFKDRYEWLAWEDEVHCFDRLIAAIEDRKRDVFYIRDDDGSMDENIRIVFWFDN